MAGPFLHSRAGPDVVQGCARMPQNRRRTTSPCFDASGWIQAGRKALGTSGADGGRGTADGGRATGGRAINGKQKEVQRQAGRKIRTFRRR